MRPAHSLQKRTHLRSRWIAIAAASLILITQLLLHWHFPPLSLLTSNTKSGSEAAFNNLGHVSGHAEPCLVREGKSDRKRVRAVVGVQTGFNAPHPESRYDYALRRAKLRESWFPSGIAQLARLPSMIKLRTAVAVSPVFLNCYGHGIRVWHRCSRAASACLTALKVDSRLGSSGMEAIKHRK